MSLQPHAPTARERESFWADVPIGQEWPFLDPTPAAYALIDARTYMATRTRSEAVREPRKRLRVWHRDGFSNGYATVAPVWTWRCPEPEHDLSCGKVYTQRSFPTFKATLADALAHVAEHHTKPLLEAMEAAELAQKPAEDAFWRRHYADAESDEHAEPVGNPDKHRTITVTPDQFEAVQRIFDAFAVRYSADDETPLQRAHRANGPRA